MSIKKRLQMNKIAYNILRFKRLAAIDLDSVLNKYIIDFRNNILNNHSLFTDLLVSTGISADQAKKAKDIIVRIQAESNSQNFYNALLYCIKKENWNNYYSTFSKECGNSITRNVLYEATKQINSCYRKLKNYNTSDGPQEFIKTLVQSKALPAACYGYLGIKLDAIPDIIQLKPGEHLPARVLSIYSYDDDASSSDEFESNINIPNISGKDIGIVMDLLKKIVPPNENDNVMNAEAIKLWQELQSAAITGNWPSKINVLSPKERMTLRNFLERGSGAQIVEHIDADAFATKNMETILRSPFARKWVDDISNTYAVIVGRIHELEDQKKQLENNKKLSPEMRDKQISEIDKSLKEHVNYEDEINKITAEFMRTNSKQIQIQFFQALHRNYSTVYNEYRRLTKKTLNVNDLSPEDRKMRASLIPNINELKLVNSAKLLEGLRDAINTKIREGLKNYNDPTYLVEDENHNEYNIYKAQSYILPVVRAILNKDIAEEVKKLFEDFKTTVDDNGNIKSEKCKNIIVKDSMDGKAKINQFAIKKCVNEIVNNLSSKRIEEMFKEHSGFYFVEGKSKDADITSYIERIRLWLSPEARALIYMQAYPLIKECNRNLRKWREQNNVNIEVERYQNSLQALNDQIETLTKDLATLSKKLKNDPNNLEAKKEYNSKADELTKLQDRKDELEFNKPSNSTSLPEKMNNETIFDLDIDQILFDERPSKDQIYSDKDPDIEQISFDENPKKNNNKNSNTTNVDISDNESFNWQLDDFKNPANKFRQKSDIGLGDNSDDRESDSLAVDIWVKLEPRETEIKDALQAIMNAQRNNNDALDNGDLDDQIEQVENICEGLNIDEVGRHYFPSSWENINKINKSSDDEIWSF